MESKKQETTDLLGTLYHLVEPYLIPAGIVLATLTLIYWLITRVAIHQFAVWKEVHGYSTGEVITAPTKYPLKLFRERVLRKPPVVTYRVTQSRALLNIKEELMKHRKVEDALAPKSDSHLWLVERGTVTRDITEGSMWDGSVKVVGTKQVPKTYHYDRSAWLSPYMKTVKIFNNEKRGGSFDGEKQRYLPRKHVATIAKRLTVREPFPSEARGYKYHPGKGEIFVIEIDCGHSTPKEVRSALGNSIETALWDKGKYEVKDLDPKHRSKIKLLVTTPGIKDVLHSSNMPTGKEFSEAHPVPRDMSVIPFAITDKGDVWNLSRIHTLFVGQTGSGKSSLVNTVCAQLAPAILEGTAKLYAIDPKPDGEITKYWSSATRFFTEVGFAGEYDKWVEIIKTVTEPLDPETPGGATVKRTEIQSRDEVASGEAAKAIKSLTWNPTKEDPLVVLLIDELPTFLRQLKKYLSAAEYKKITDKINIILYMGRSSGTLFFAGTQEMSENAIEPIARSQFPNRVALRMESPYFNDMILGEGAAKNGFNAAEFPEKDPEFKGRAYARGEEGSPVQIRFPYYTVEEILEILLPFIPETEEEEPEAAAETTETIAPGVTDEDRNTLAAALAKLNDQT